MRRAESALHVALRRAAHQMVDRPLVFQDPFAVPLLGRRYAEKLRRTPRLSSLRRDRPWSRALRAFAVARSIYAEEVLAAAVARGVRQYCLLGAGFDTFAWRNPYPELWVWEIDQPATALWKRELAVEAGLPTPHRCSFVTADLADPELPSRLQAAGMRIEEPAVFALLGVAPYLEAAVFRALLALPRGHGPDSAVVFDYRLPRESLGEEEQRQHDSLAARVAAAGEPFRSAWTPEAVAAELHQFEAREDLDTDALNARYFAGREDGLAVRGDAVRLVSAAC